MTSWLNLIGLCFDILGAILIYRYGLIADLQSALEETEYKNKINWNVIRSKSGFISLIVGFALQGFSCGIQINSTNNHQPIQHEQRR